MKARAYLLAFALGALAACPLSAQQPVVQPKLKALADTMIPPGDYIRTNGSASTELRNYVSGQLDSLSRVPKDTVRIFVPVIVHDTIHDTIYVPADSTPTVPVDTLPPIELPSDSLWNREVKDTLIVGDLVLTGDTVLIGRNVRVRGNVRCTAGMLVMRPGSSLTFVGADPNAYVGGGMGFAPEFANDIGLWVGGTCETDFRGTPKESWNRTGVSSAWLATDELWSAPVAAGDFLPHRYTLGAPVPRANALVPPTEIVNVTRDLVITGPGHVHISACAPQRIEYLQLVNMGVSNVASQGAVLGRYALHMHMMGECSDSSFVRGVSSVDAKGKVFVIHASHGVTLEDVVSVNSYGECFWWDFGSETNDISVNRLGCLAVQMPDSISGTQSNVPGVSLPAGNRMSMTNSWVAAVFGGKLAVGFDWPEPTTVFQGRPLVWRFDGNTGHNNRGPAARFWTNLGDAHIVNDFASYHNGGGCVENGAYGSGTEYHGLLCFEDGYLVSNDFSANLAAFNQNASPILNTAGRVGQLTDCNVSSLEGPAYEVGHRQLPGDPNEYQLIQDCTFKAGPGQPLVKLIDATNPARLNFVLTNVRPEDITFLASPGNEGSDILIDPDGDGPLKGWRVQWINGQKKVTNR